MDRDEAHERLAQMEGKALLRAAKELLDENVHLRKMVEAIANNGVCETCVVEFYQQRLAEGWRAAGMVVTARNERDLIDGIRDAINQKADVIGFTVTCGPPRMTGSSE